MEEGGEWDDGGEPRRVTGRRRRLRWTIATGIALFAHCTSGSDDVLVSRERRNRNDYTRNNILCRLDFKAGNETPKIGLPRSGVKTRNWHRSEYMQSEVFG
ncbi:hypothetical protein EVAR_78662_1 [Eumeta japonica]|uniref:Uncharacterized protein n=1 Tax=Eumeta variegata TaxID=151549 RepID=A0A4C1U7X1_EUMVA|nr:hypothetical protein EVAR_78662_1 [Eumeta japonica]